MIEDNAYPALLLNADFRPLSYAPLSTLTTRESIEAVYSGRVTVIEHYDAWARSPSTRVRLPSVVALRDFVDLDRPAALTRYNLLLAYDFRCAYCEARFHTRDLTFEHIVPRSHNGKSSWMNLVPACAPCNQRKANRTPEQAGMELKRPAYHPTLNELNRCARMHPKTENLHQTWVDFLYWDSDLAN